MSPFGPIAPFRCAAKFSRYRGIADSSKRSAEARGDQVSTAPAVRAASDHSMASICNASVWEGFWGMCSSCARAPDAKAIDGPVE
jgi:hypothetical protein